MHTRMHYTAQWLGHAIVIFAEVVVTVIIILLELQVRLGVLLGLSRDLS